jgi:hypothetical protein
VDSRECATWSPGLPSGYSTATWNASSTTILSPLVSQCADPQRCWRGFAYRRSDGIGVVPLALFGT